MAETKEGYNRGPARVPGKSSGLLLRPEDQPGVRRGRQEGVGDSGARGGRQEAPPPTCSTSPGSTGRRAAGAGGQGPMWKIDLEITDGLVHGGQSPSLSQSTDSRLLSSR